MNSDENPKPIPIGKVDMPSGSLAVFDVGIVGLVLSGQVPEVPAVLIDGFEPNRSYEVFGVPRDGDASNLQDDYRCRWQSVIVRVADGVVECSEKAGEVIVDFARVLFIDSHARTGWIHEDSIDGLADFVFWGRDANSLADVVQAQLVDDEPGTFGWLDQPIATIVEIAEQVESESGTRGFRLATDFRPHSHHWRALREVARSENEAGTLQIDGSQACLWMTTRGDGIFPVFRDLDKHGRLLCVRVQLEDA